jgi:predicted membrane protein
MIQVASIAGAVLILAEYAAHQAGALGRDSIAYHLLNILGGAVLLVVAVHHLQVGFIILESVWTAISVAALVRTALRGGGRA